MAKYGLTPQGPNIKRLDVILDEMHTKLSKRWGVNTRQNPESFLGHLMTEVGDKCAELWEFGEQIYYSQYPATAEGTSLDSAAQFGGSTREAAAKSYYPIHCTGRDGTTLAVGTMIASETNPVTYLSLTDARMITRESFNKAKIKIASVSQKDVYTIAINGEVFSFAPASENQVDILSGLASKIRADLYHTSVDEENQCLIIEATDPISSNVLVLSENLTTDTVTSIITFGTVEMGDILIPDNVITNIVKADAGLLSVVNMCGYIAGRSEETDVEFRQSYADKIFNRSSRMLESIRSAILNNVQGVRSVAPYENDTHEWDEYGRPPHSIEIVVDGGDSSQIAKQILNNKAGGINTFGDVVVVVPGEYDEDITIRFNRPQTVYTWFRIGLTLSKNQSVPPNYVELLRQVVLDKMDTLNAGDNVIPDEFRSDLYRACSGFTYADISLFTTTDSSAEPTEYPDRSAEITARQRAFTSKVMIEVAIDG